MIAFNGGQLPGHDTVETAEFDPTTRQVKFQFVRFGPSEDNAGAFFSEVNPTECQACHGTTPHYIYRTYADWGGGQMRDTVAAALLAAGLSHCRTTPVSGVPRAPYCMMGVCFDCLVTIDGVGSRQACLVPVQAGMAIETQLGKREAGR